MPKSVEYSDRARHQLEEIKAYIAKDNPAAALRIIEHITTSADDLIEFPMTGKPWLRAGTRKLVLSKYPYSIIYKLTASQIIVLAVAHHSLKIA